MFLRLDSCNIFILQYNKLKYRFIKPKCDGRKTGQTLESKLQKLKNLLFWVELPHLFSLLYAIFVIVGV